MESDRLENAEAATEPVQEQTDLTGSGTIYDDIFRISAQNYPFLFIPLINQTHGTYYPLTAEIQQLRNEFLVMDGKFITDVIFQIGDQLYHFECQSNPDGTITFRLVEYTFAIAVDQMRQKGKTDKLQFPASAAIYLRHTRNTPDQLTVCIANAEQASIIITFPVVKVKELTREDIFEKNLLLFLPYYSMRYENDWNKMEVEPVLFQGFLDDLGYLIDRVWMGTDYPNLFTTTFKSDLCNMLQLLTEYLLRDHPRLLKGFKKMINVKSGSFTFETLQKKLAEKDATIAEMGSALAETKSALAEKDSTITRLKALLEAAGIPADSL